jgi:hypothetical protein
MRRGWQVVAPEELLVVPAGKVVTSLSFLDTCQFVVREPGE